MTVKDAKGNIIYNLHRHGDVGWTKFWEIGSGIS